MKEDSTKLKKKALKSSLIESIEKALKIGPAADTDDKKLKKLRKSIRDAAKKITKRYLEKHGEKPAKDKPTSGQNRKNQLIRDKSKQQKKKTDGPVLL